MINRKLEEHWRIIKNPFQTSSPIFLCAWGLHLWESSLLYTS